MKIRKFPTRVGVFFGIVIIGVIAFIAGRPAFLGAPTQTFESQQAMADLAYQVNLGPRIPGSPAHDQEVQWLMDTLKKTGWDASKQETTRMGHAVENVIAKRGSGSPWTVIGAHYDSRLWANQDQDPAKQHDPVPGANDGASGVAVLTELGRVLPADLPGQVWLVFFDVEDNGEIPGWDWLLGSEAFVDSLQAKPDAAVILDMIGDANLNIYQELNSNPRITQQVWETAARLGYSQQFIPSPKYSMIDDHTPFLNAGIPAIDIIDFDYPYWHTTEDTVDKCSANSLKAVGDTIQAWLIQEHKSTP